MTAEHTSSTADVVIVGAGPAGTAAAAHLAQLGVKDVVLVVAGGTRCRLTPARRPRKLIAAM